MSSFHSVSISIVTIEGTNCKLGILGEVATKTGGSVSREFFSYTINYSYNKQLLSILGKNS